MRRFAFIPAVIVLFAVSCTVNQTIVIRNDGSGALFMRVEISKVFRDYLLSLAELAGQNDIVKEGKVFNLKDIQKGFETRPALTVKRIASPTPETLEADLEYKSIQEVFARDEAVKGSGALLLSESEGVKTVKIHLDRTNYKQISTLFPLLSDPLFEGMGPQVNDTITEEEYLEMIKFSLGDEGPGLLKKSYIDLAIQPEGEIVSQTGGTVAKGIVTFRIPLIRLLLLDKPLDYSVSYK